MKPKSRLNYLHPGVFRKVSVLAAAGLLISLSTYATAQTPYEAHYSDAAPQAPPAQEMPQGMMGDRWDDGRHDARPRNDGHDGKLPDDGRKQSLLC